MPKFRKPLPAELPEPETIDIKALASSLKSGELDMICVLGPTASGKTRYAVGLARELGQMGLKAEIISADSRQVYRGMDIGTGKDLSEYGEIPYHLIDIREPGAQYNVYDFSQDFRAAYDDMRARGCVPILCGGTGLYINAVLSDYDFRSSKPLSAKGDIVCSDGSLCSADIPFARGGGIRAYVIGTLVSREVRNARIDARLASRMEEGMADEIRSLLAGGVPAEKLIAYGLEYKYVTLFVTGSITYDEMMLKLSTAIHQFAKRQMTWFRGMERSGIHIHWTEV